jgi:DNA-directed RNA polymerase specialized sigma24 family protein
MKQASTLGEVLYAGHWNVVVLESDWMELLQSIRAGNRFALHALFERAHAPVFFLALRMLKVPRTGEELTLDVFWDIWRGAARYEEGDQTVLSWIMGLTRARAIDRLLLRSRSQPRAAHASGTPLPEAPFASLQSGLARRLAVSTGGRPLAPPTRQWSEPEWKEVAPGISCQLLATDNRKHRVSMLVRLAPGTDYPPHTHAGSEELHLLDGELWIDERKLLPGEYNRAVAGTADRRVWSETGCMCFLMTSTRDQLG